MSSGFFWVNGSPQSFASVYEVYTEKVIRNASQAVAISIKAGEAKMKEFISSRPSSKSGKSGRIDTGNMLNAVSSGSVDIGGSVVSGEFGWIGTGEPYFLYQEQGARIWTGAMIEPMFALRDAGLFSWEYFLREIQKQIRAAA